MVTRPARPAVARPDAATDTTLVSVLVHWTLATGAPALVTTSGSVSPARRTERVAVTWSAPPDGDVGVDEELSHPERTSASPAIAVATSRDVTARL